MAGRKRGESSKSYQEHEPLTTITPGFIVTSYVIPNKRTPSTVMASATATENAYIYLPIQHRVPA